MGQCFIASFLPPSTRSGARSIASFLPQAHAAVRCYIPDSGNAGEGCIPAKVLNHGRNSSDRCAIAGWEPPATLSLKKAICANHVIDARNGAKSLRCRCNLVGTSQNRGPKRAWPKFAPISERNSSRNLASSPSLLVPFLPFTENVAAVARLLTGAVGKPDAASPEAGSSDGGGGKATPKIPGSFCNRYDRQWAATTFRPIASHHTQEGCDRQRETSSLSFIHLLIQYRKNMFAAFSHLAFGLVAEQLVDLDCSRSVNTS